MIRTTTIIALVTSSLAIQPVFAAIVKRGELSKDVYIDEHLGKSIPLDLEFKNQDGDSVKIADYFNKGRPVIIAPVYYSCTRLCTFVLNGLTQAVKEQTGLLPGQEYTLLTVSIHPNEQPQLAKYKRANYFKTLPEVHQKNEELSKGWQFLTGSEKNIKALTNALGFMYKKDGKEYAHTASLMFLTDKGKIARYLYGIKFRKGDFRLAILESARGKIGNVVDRLILFCVKYDEYTGHYTAIAKNVMLVGVLLFTASLIGLLGFLWYQEKEGTKRRNPKKKIRKSNTEES